MSADHLLIKAAKMKPAHRRPFWIINQSFIYKDHIRLFQSDNDMVSVMTNPQKATELSLKPYEELKVDGIELFTSPYLPACFMNLGCELNVSSQKINFPVRKSTNINNLVLPKIDKELKCVLETIRNLSVQSFDAPIIGGCAGSFSFASLLIDGLISKEMPYTKAILYMHENAFLQLLSIISDFIIEYLKAQIESGVEIICIHDPFISLMRYEDFEKLYLPKLIEIVNSVKDSDIPIIYNSPNIVPIIDLIAETDIDVFTIDRNVSSKVLIEKSKNRYSIQGNFDPLILFSTPDTLENQINMHLQYLGRNHGIIGSFCKDIPEFTAIENLKFFIRKYQELSSGYATS